MTRRNTASGNTGNCLIHGWSGFLLLQASLEYILPMFPDGGRVLTLREEPDGTRSGWRNKIGKLCSLTSQTGVEQARQNAGPLATHIHFVVDDLIHFKAAQTGPSFEIVLALFYLERKIFSELVKAVRPGGLLLYKTHTVSQARLAGGPKNPAHFLEPGELLQLAKEMRVLHYRETEAEKATAELIAQKEIPPQTSRT